MSKTVKQFVTHAQVKITSSLPKFVVRTVRKSYAIYNMRTKFLTGDENQTVGEYKRVYSPLRKPSKLLDAVEVLDKSTGFDTENSKIYLEKNLEKFAEKLVTEALNQMVNPTHITLLENNQGVETWAVYDANTIRRLVGRSGTTLQFGISPITAIRFTGPARVRVTKVLANVKRRQARAKKASGK